MNHKIPYSVPEGYFPSMERRLLEIPARKTRMKFAPYLALAASFALAALAGNYILMKSAADRPASDEDIVEYLIDSGTTLAQLEDAADYVNY